MKAGQEGGVGNVRACQRREKREHGAGSGNGAACLLQFTDEAFDLTQSQ